MRDRRRRHKRTMTYSASACRGLGHRCDSASCLPPASCLFVGHSKLDMLVSMWLMIRILVATYYVLGKCTLIHLDFAGQLGKFADNMSSCQACTVYGSTGHLNPSGCQFCGIICLRSLRRGSHWLHHDAVLETD